MNQADFAQEMRAGTQMSKKRQAALAFRLGMPAILAQLTNIVMEYIDAAMVGRLGAQASASIGLVASSTWLVGSLAGAAVTGFSVQVAHAVGAGNLPRARRILRQAITANLIFSLAMGIACVLLSAPLPALLGAEVAIRQDASDYLRIYSLFLPVISIHILMAQMLQCSGDMKTPSLISALECLMDVGFNCLLIFPSRTVRFKSLSLHIPGAGLGVKGAALGTALSIACAAAILSFVTLLRSENLALWPVFKRAGHKAEQVRWLPESAILKKALHIALPVAGENAAQNLAQIASSRIVAPLGTIAIAANSFAVTAEAFCYMPGYGISMAATTMVGQACGAKRRDLAKSFAWMTTALGMLLMALGGVIMYFLCPAVFDFLTPDAGVRALGVRVLRIELFAEPLFGASIVATGALRGAGDTFVPALIDLICVWGVRILTALLLTSRIGLAGVWIAMAIDLSVRGTLFLIRLARGRWLKKIDE